MKKDKKEINNLLMRKKKAILGMNTAQQFILGILTLAIISVTVLIVFAVLQNTLPTIRTTIPFVNQSTGIIMNHTTAYQIAGTTTLLDCAATITEVRNISEGTQGYLHQVRPNSPMTSPMLPS